MNSGRFHFAYVGSRTSQQRHGHGAGITVWRMGENSDPWQEVQTVPDLFNPSYLALDRDKRFLYAVHGDATEISAFAIDGESGRLRFLNRQSTHGKNPVHVSVSPDNRYVVVANHLTVDGYKSNIAALRRHEDGSLGELSDLLALSGKPGPFCAEQPFPKPHQVAFDPAGCYLSVPDKGCDQVLSYTLDADGKFAAAGGPGMHTREGAGPRHIVFHPHLPFAYVVDELDSTVIACHYDAKRGGLSPFQVLPSLPDDFFGHSRAAEIAISADGRFIYASNRGHDSIVTCSVDPASGRLAVLNWQSCGGKTPRFFALSPAGTMLFIANEGSGTITASPRDAESGRLGEARVVAHTGTPTAIVFSGSAGV